MFSQRYYILAELSLLRIHHPPGMYVSPCDDNLLKWLGIVSIRSGYYFGGIFNFVIHLPFDFPSTKVPIVYMPKGFYHPLVDADSGVVDLSSDFSTWDADKHHIWHILHHLRRLLISPTSVLNMTKLDQPPIKKNSNNSVFANNVAASTLIYDQNEFEVQAKICVSKLSLWNMPSTDDVPVITGHPTLDISGWSDDTVLNEARHQLQNYPSPNPIEDCLSQGYSWMDPKTMSIFAIESANRSSDES